jgi:penicillin V acylase-like amidase (Ntn superfamily)
MRTLLRLTFASFMAALVTVSSLPTLACSTLMAKNAIGEMGWLGKNYDWHSGHGALLINHRNREKVNGHPNSPVPFSWVSKFGSISFTQFGREFPIGGVNEKGLAVETLWLSVSDYPEPEEQTLPVLNELQWVQFILDRSATVEEAIFNSRHVQAVPIMSAVHYFVCDKTQCAVFEYLGGQLSIEKTDAGQRYSVLTNSSYAETLLNLRRYTNFGGNETIPNDYDSMARFARLANTLKNSPVASNFEDIATRLQGVRSSSQTVWVLGYNLKDQKVEWQTKQRMAKKTFSFANLNFDCSDKTYGLDMNSALQGDVTSNLQELTPELNAALINQNDFIPEELRTEMTTYPARATRCIR